MMLIQRAYDQNCFIAAANIIFNDLFFLMNESFPTTFSVGPITIRIRSAILPGYNSLCFCCFISIAFENVLPVVKRTR